MTHHSWPNVNKKISQLWFYTPHCVVKGSKNTDISLVVEFKACSGTVDGGSVILSFHVLDRQMVFCIHVPHQVTTYNPVEFERVVLISIYFLFFLQILGTG